MSETKTILQQTYKDFKHFMNEQGPSRLMVNYYQVNIIANIFQNRKISLKTITGAFQETNDAGFAYMSDWIRFLNDFLNIRNALQPAVITTLAFTCYNKYSYFTLADLKLLFDFILESKYGTFYGSVDTQRILTSFSEYAKERREFEDKLIQKEKERLKKLEDDKERVLPDLAKYKNVAKFMNLPLNKI